MRHSTTPTIPTDHLDVAVTVRLAGPADQPAVERLAVLDSARAPSGDVLLAEVGDEVRAAVPVAGGTAIADPFRPTADLVALLRERAGQLSASGRPAGRLHGLRLRAA